jgi:hypothetical protein
VFCAAGVGADSGCEYAGVRNSSGRYEYRAHPSRNLFPVLATASCVSFHIVYPVCGYYALNAHLPYCIYNIMIDTDSVANIFLRPMHI